MEKYLIYSLLAGFLITVLSTRVLIPVLRRLKFGQHILEIGPSWHMSKSGTPTMGGVAFIISAVIVVPMIALLSGYRFSGALWTVFFYTVAGGLIGLTDDLIKLKRKQNGGLSAKAKLGLQIIAAVIFVIVMRRWDYISTEIYIPFAAKMVDIGILYYPMAVLFLCGFSNAVNLSDGLDGLCASVSAVVTLFLALSAISQADFSNSVFAVMLCGICLGFLVYNFHPAKIFMGDTGSLFLGGAVGALALSSKANTLLLIYGIMYIVEAVSVILQVAYYKATKKRLFLMAPYHHHLEKKGLSEIKITLIFTLVTLLFSALGYFFA